VTASPDIIRRGWDTPAAPVWQAGASFLSTGERSGLLPGPLRYLRCNRDGLSRMEQRASKPRKDGQVGVELHLRQSAHPEWCQAVVGLEFSEQSFGGSASLVEVAESLSVARDHRHEPSTQGERQDWLLALHAFERDHGQHFAGFALGVDSVVVVSLIRRHGFGAEAASERGIKQRRGEVGFVVAPGRDLPCHRQLRCPHDASGSL